MQAFVISIAYCTDGGDVALEIPQVFWDRQAGYRHYIEGGGDPVPKGHRIERLATTGGRTITLDVVDIPDRKKYNKDFIEDLVGKIQRGEISQSEASRLYGPSQSRISEWVREYSS